jgi:hypothetical protein
MQLENYAARQSILVLIKLFYKNDRKLILVFTIILIQVFFFSYKDMKSVRIQEILKNAIEEVNFF